MFVHVTIYNTKHNPLKIIKYIVDNVIFKIILWPCNASESEFYGFGNFGYLALGKFWKSVGNFFNGFWYEP